jgi:cytochrome b subunit of formate dehydrogenase
MTAQKSIRPLLDREYFQIETNGTTTQKLVFWIMGALVTVLVVVTGVIINNFNARLDRIENNIQIVSTKIDAHGERLAVVETKVREIDKKIDYLLR